MKCCRDFRGARGIILAVFLLIFKANGQPSTDEMKNPMMVNFQLHHIVLFTDKADRGRLHIFANVLYDDLTFLKEDTVFVSEYRATFSVMDKDGKYLESKRLNRVVTTKDYFETNSQDKFDQLEIEFDLKPGDYNLIFEFFDRETREPQRQDLKVNIPSMINSDILISGPILLDTIIVNEEGVLTLWPSFSSDMFSGLKALWVYFEVFCKKYPADLEINYHLLDSHGEERITGNFSRHIEAPVLRDRFALDIKEFTFDNYQLVLAINNGDKSAQAKRNFRVHSPGLPPSIQNLDEAIDQLIYIATERDIVRLKESFHGRRVETFIKFWNKWAGDEAEGYKMMDEYYRRGTEADQLFNEGGWKCDRGHVYMIYGPPSEIDRHPYDIYGKAYEIWYYLEENKKFLFVDEGGFGDYRLKSPLWGY